MKRNSKHNLLPHRLFILLLFTFLPNLYVYAQGEIDTQDKIFFRNERTYAFNLNSNGWGFDFRYGKRINAYRHRLYEIQFAEMKHPKEFKSSNPYIYTQDRYVFGKLNTFMNIRGGYGLQRQLYEKYDKGGISIRRYFTTGISIGILKPVYYEVLYPRDTIKEEKFDPVKHQLGDILGKASFFKGFNEITITPGINAKYGYTFEFSKRDDVFRAFELGAMLDFFLIKPEILSLAKNNNYYLTLFISYRFGRIVDNRFKNIPEIAPY